MNEFFSWSVFWGLLLTLVSYEIGLVLKRRFSSPLLNPLLISIVICIGTVLALHVDYDRYYESARYISFLLTPATVCLAIPLHKQFRLLKHNSKAVFAGILSGVLTSACVILILSILLGLDHREYVSLLPKSITTAIGMGVSEELGGYVPITVAMIVLTGIFGNVFAELLFRLFKIQNPVARGVALGTASHAIGTSKAMELGEIEGAMSSLSIVIAGILTVAGASLFSMFL